MGADEGYSFFIHKFITILDKEAPLITKNINDKTKIREGWMTKSILNCSSKLSKLYSKSIGKSPDSVEMQQYKTYQTTLNAVRRKARYTYMDLKLNRCVNNMKKTWKELNNIIGKTNDKRNISSIFKSQSNELISDKNEIANQFGEFFSSIGKNIAKTLPNTNQDFKQFMKTPNRNSIFLEPTDEHEVKKIILNMKNKNSAGVDTISATILKKINAAIMKPLAILINKSMTEGVFPKELKVAKVTPIYKGKDKTEFNNYRPISLLNVISKIYEKIMHNRLYKFCDRFKILHEGQYGFRTGRSTIDALTELCGKIYKGIDNNNNILAVNLDLSKAFDLIDHNILLQKLSMYGIRGNALAWFKSYLNNRKLCVSYNNTQSKYFDVQIGVPQGSILGPLLFILYVNDIFEAVTHSEIISFADDTTLYKIGNCNKLLFSEINEDLSNINKWYICNKLSLNINKSNYILFRKRNNKYNDEFNLKINNILLERKNNVFLLGMHLDEYMSWDTHFKHIKSKLNSSLYFLKQLKHTLSTKHLKMIYFALFQSYLQYGCLLWTNTKTTNINTILKLQVKALKCINHGKRTSFQEQQILNINALKSLALCQFMHRISNKNISNTISSLFTLNDTIHTHYTRQSNAPHIFKYKYKQTLDSFLHQGPMKWQTIPANIKSLPPSSFKRKVKLLIL